jgi:hypothetical protein
LPESAFVRKAMSGFDARRPRCAARRACTHDS